MQYEVAGREATTSATDGHLKTLRNLEAAVDFLAKHQIYDDEIVSVSANEFEGCVHIKADCVRRLAIADQLRHNQLGHYTGSVDGVSVETIDHERFVKEEAAKV